MTFVAALALFTVTQALPDNYPFGPFTGPEEARAAARMERRLAKPDGIAVAVEVNCDDSGDSGSDVDELVAREFLIRHFDRALPALLERMRREDADHSSNHARLCGAGARTLIADAVCFGYAIGGSGPTLDAHPRAVAARSRVADTLVKALEAKRLPRNLLLDALLGAREYGRGGRAYSLAFDDLCSGGKDVVYRATRPLLEALGAPAKKPGPPPLPHVPETNRDKAFRLLSYGVADRFIAEAKVRAFLERPETLPLAAVTLERMGADASSAVPGLEKTLDALRFSGNFGDDEDDFALLGDSFDLFMLLGPRANAALPALARVAARWEAPECRTFGTRYYLEVARAAYARGQAQNSVAVLGPLLRCPQGGAIAGALGEEFGQASVPSLRAALHDATLAPETRFNAAAVLQDDLGQELSDADWKVVDTLPGKLERRKSALIPTDSSR
jgi:hypothetical protein